MAQFAEKKTAPASGLKAIRFFRPRKAKRAGATGPTNLTEGSISRRKSEVSVGNVDCYLNQRGDDSEITDVVKATDVLDTLNVYMDTLGRDAALDFDNVLTNAIFGDATSNAKALALGVGTVAQTTLFNSNSTWGVATANFFERFAGVVNTGNSANDFGTLAGLTPAQGKFTRLEHLRAITQLKANDVPPPDGQVYAVSTPPEVMFDIRQDATLVAAMTQRDNDKLYKYESFELDGGAFLESTNPWKESVYGTYAAAGTVFGIAYMGKEALGTVKLSNNIAGGDPGAPKITVLDQPDKYDPYNQLIIVAWKCFYGAILLVTGDATDVPRCVALRVQSSFK